MPYGPTPPPRLADAGAAAAAAAPYKISVLSTSYSYSSSSSSYSTSSSSSSSIGPQGVGQDIILFPGSKQMHMRAQDLFRECKVKHARYYFALLVTCVELRLRMVKLTRLEMPAISPVTRS